MALKNIGIAGCLGRMGQELVKETINNKNLNFIGGFEQPQHENIHKKISEFIGVRNDHIISDDPKKIFSDSDVVIDFTTPQSTLKNILIAAEQNTALVVGTTGLNDKIMN